MPKFTVRLIDRKEIATNTMAFTFTKPKDFVYKAGQYVDLSLIAPPETDDEGNTRSFSLASTPAEGALMIATRMRDTAFKRVIKALPLESELQLAGPMGSFTLHSDATRPAIFLTGGIGITPVRSIIAQAIRDKAPHQMYLFYSNRTISDAAFLEELTQLTVDHNAVHVIPTVTKMDPAQESWIGETGYIDAQMLARHTADVVKPIYYISGPEAMVGAMRKLLAEQGVGDDDIRAEEFAGY